MLCSTCGRTEWRTVRKSDGPICVSWRAWGPLFNWVVSWLVSVKWFVVSSLDSSRNCWAERHPNSTGDEARIIPDIEKHLANALVFSTFTSLALSLMLSCLPYHLSMTSLSVELAGCHTVTTTSAQPIFLNVKRLIVRRLPFIGSSEIAVEDIE